MEKNIKTAGFWFCLLAFGWLASCGTARRGEPFQGTTAGSLGQERHPELAAGKAIFMKNCQPCHPGGETGLGPSINNKPVPGFVVRLQIRKGFGAMPAFKKNMISATEMDDLMAYLKTLRKDMPSEEITSSVHPKQ